MGQGPPHMFVRQATGPKSQMHAKSMFVRLESIDPNFSTSISKQGFFVTNPDIVFA